MGRISHNIFNYSFTKGYLGCLQVLVIINRAAINTHIQAFCVTVFSFFCDKCPIIQSLSHKVVAYLIIEETKKCFPAWLNHLIFPKVMYESSRLSQSSSHTFCHSHQHLVVSLYFILAILQSS